MACKCVSYVYLMRRDDGAYKIGQSHRPATRRIALQKAFKARFTLLAKIATSRPLWMEFQAHGIFRERSIGREFFALTDADVEEFKALRDTILHNPPCRYAPAGNRASNHDKDSFSYGNRERIE